VSNKSNEFIEMEIIKDEKGQLLQLVCEDGTKKIFELKDFPYQRGGPVIAGSWCIEEIKEKE